MLVDLSREEGKTSEGGNQTLTADCGELLVGSNAGCYRRREYLRSGEGNKEEW